MNCCRGRSLFSRVRLLSNTNSRFSLRTIHGNRLAPMFFNSTLAGFNIRPFLRRFLRLAAPPLPERAISRGIRPVSSFFSTFIFGVRTGVGGTRHSEITFVHVYDNGFRGGVRIFRIRNGGGVHLSRPRRVVTRRERVISRTCTNSVVNIFSPNVFSVNSAVYSPKRGMRFEKVPAFTPRRFTLIHRGSAVGHGRFVGNADRVTRRNTVRVFRRLSTNVRRIVINIMNMLRFSILGCELRGRCGYSVVVRALPCRFVH